MRKRFLVWSGTALFIGTIAFAGCGKKEEPSAKGSVPTEPRTTASPSSSRSSAGSVSSSGW